MRDERGAARRRVAAITGASLLVAAIVWAGGTPGALAKSKPPKPVPAWYMTATTVTDLVRQAKHSACVFAKEQPKSPRVMLFDFGAASKYPDGKFGATLREIRRFRNSGILKALEAASRAYHRCHRKGSATITYGNTNSIAGHMSKADSLEAGLNQSLTVRRLHKFQRSQHHYRHQSAAAAGDIEPGFGLPGVSKALVDGANGGATYYDFGNAGGCPGQPGSQGCYNGWDLQDLGEVSMGGRSLPLPEVYRPYEATQWERVQRHWEGKYFFAGVTAAPNEPLAPAESWRTLKRRAGRVGRELVSIRDTGSNRSAARRGEGGGVALGGPMTGTIGAHLVSGPQGFFSTSAIYPAQNGWVASDHRRFVAVEAGADPIHPSTGVLGVFRQSYVDVTQSERLIKVPGAGALRLTGASGGRGRAAPYGPSATLRFTGERGVSGTLDVSAGSVTVDSNSTGGA
jgi:hypothetical protein